MTSARPIQSPTEGGAVVTGSQNQPKIIVEDVTLDYANLNTGNYIRALDGCSAEIKENEFFCILGPSGCGKSTLLYLIAGLLRPTRGRILVGGRFVKGPGADRGVVFQEYALLPWRTVSDNVALGLKIKGIRREDRNHVAQQFIDLVGLSGFEDKFPHELSGGMRQRVAVARTLANSPEVMLMDEPFGAVDAQTRTTLQEELTRIWGQAKLTVVFVTHNVDEAIFLGDRVLVMTPRPGRVHATVQIGIPREERVWATLERDLRFVTLKSSISGMLRSLGAAHNDVDQ